MTNDKAMRQAIAETIKGELKMNWDLAYDIADAIISRLSELQPVNTTCPTCGYPLTLQGNGIAERICTCNKVQPVNKADELSAREYAETIVRQNSDTFDSFSMGIHQFSGDDMECSYYDGCQKVRTELRDEIDGYKSALGDLRAEKALIESLNETIDVELTDCGAKHLNKYHKELSEKFKTVTWKYDYKECDIYKDQAYSIFSVFEPFFHAGASMPFINLRKSK